MERFISTKFCRLLRDASQTGVDADARVLENSYDEFALLMFAEGDASTGKAAFHNTLAYTRVELESLTEVSGKKCGNLSPQSHCTD